MCRTHPAAARSVEQGWTAERRALRERAATAPDPGLAESMVDAVDAAAAAREPEFDQLRYGAEVRMAAGLPANAVLPREQNERLAEECFPDLHAGVALLDPASPLALRPAGAGAAYDREVRALVGSDVRAGADFQWTMQYGGSWKLRDAAPVPQTHLLAHVCELERRAETAGRLVPLDTGPGAQRAVAARAASATVDVLSVLASRGVEVSFAPVEQTQVTRGDGRLQLSIPETWRGPAAGEAVEPLSATQPLSALDRLASGADTFAPPDRAALSDLYYRGVGVASAHVLSSGEIAFTMSDTLDRVRSAAPDPAVLNRRQLEHFAARMTAAAYGESAPAGADTAFAAPRGFAAQAETLDRLLDREAAVEARVLQSAAAVHADAGFAVKQAAERSVATLKRDLDAFDAAGVPVRLVDGPELAYRPDPRSWTEQRAAGSRPADALEVPERLLDARQPARALVEGHARVYEAVSLATGHPQRANRLQALAVLHAQAGARVAPQVLARAREAEQAIARAYARRQLAVSWRRDVLNATSVSPPPPLTRAAAARLAVLTRWSRETGRVASLPAPQSQRELPSRANRHERPAVDRSGPPSLSAAVPLARSVASAPRRLSPAAPSVSAPARPPALLPQRGTAPAMPLRRHSPVSR